MQNINVFLLAAGTAGAIFLAVSAAVAVYWYLYGKKSLSVPRQKVQRLANPGLQLTRTACRQ